LAELYEKLLWKVVVVWEVELLRYYFQFTQKLMA